jgi:hypothetical protein
MVHSELEAKYYLRVRLTVRFIVYMFTVNVQTGPNWTSTTRFLRIDGVDLYSELEMKRNLKLAVARE